MVSTSDALIVYHHQNVTNASSKWTLASIACIACERSKRCLKDSIFYSDVFMQLITPVTYLIPSFVVDVLVSYVFMQLITPVTYLIRSFVVDILVVSN